MDRAFKTSSNNPNNPSNCNASESEQEWKLGTMIDNNPKYKELKTCQSKATDFQVGPTYTFAMWDMYMDFNEWKISNIPGMGINFQ